MSVHVSNSPTIDRVEPTATTIDRNERKGKLTGCEAERFALVHVEGCGPDPVVLESGGERLLVDQTSPGRVHQERSCTKEASVRSNLGKIETSGRSSSPVLPYVYVVLRPQTVRR